MNKQVATLEQAMKSRKFNGTHGRKITTAIKDYEMYCDLIDMDEEQIGREFFAIFDSDARDYYTQNDISKNNLQPAQEHHGISL